MSLDGLRAWIGVVERKLLMRTRVFLVLVAIAIGGAGAGIYLAVDAQNSAVSEADLQALQEQVDAQSSEAGGAELSALEAQLTALQEEVAQLRSEREGSGSKGADRDSSAGTGSESATPQNGQLRKLFEQAQGATGK